MIGDLVIRPADVAGSVAVLHGARDRAIARGDMFYARRWQACADDVAAMVTAPDPQHPPDEPAHADAPAGPRPVPMAGGSAVEPALVSA